MRTRPARRRSGSSLRPPGPSPPAASLREVDRAALAYHRHLDLTGVLELLLHVACDAVREQGGLVVVDLLRLDDHADLATSLHRVDLLDAVVALGDLLELPEALRVVLERLAACAWSRARERV